MGEEPGEDGQCPNTREKLSKTVYKKINENCGVGYFAVGEFWHLKNVAGTAIQKFIIFFSGIWAQSVVSGHLCSGWWLKESLVLSIQIREPRDNHDEPATPLLKLKPLQNAYHKS